MFDRLGDTLTVLRILQRLSQAEVAAEAGIKATQVSRYETGQVLPQLPQLERLLDALGVDLPAFLFALLHVERTVRYLEQAERLPAETIIRDAVAAHWARVTDLHLSVAQAVAEVIEERFGEGDPDTRAAMKLSEESLREVWDNEDDAVYDEVEGGGDE